MAAAGAELFSTRAGSFSKTQRDAYTYGSVLKLADLENYATIVVGRNLQSAEHVITHCAESEGDNAVKILKGRGFEAVSDALQSATA